MAVAKQQTPKPMPDYDAAVAAVKSGATEWARSSVADRITVLLEIKDALLTVSEAWAETAARKKLIPEGSPLAGEEWISGPYAVMGGCNGLIHTLQAMQGKAFLASLKKRTTASGQLAVKVCPDSIWDRLLLSGVTAEVWMQDGVTADNLAQHTASAYDIPEADRDGKVSVVLGAGNIAAIAPLDCFQKLFLEHQTVVLKLNPVNDYLYDVLSVALRPLIDRNALRIVKGDGAAGAYLCTHPDVDELHITGAGSTHDLIVWGQGAEGEAAKKAGKPSNTRRITSELGAVCPTIVVPGPWTDADIAFQGEHIATQKLHNSGFNCIACQVLVMPKTWDKSNALMASVENAIQTSTRLPYYPMAENRMEEFSGHADNVISMKRGKAPAVVRNEIRDGEDAWFEHNEVFAPAMSTYQIDETDPETYLRKAIAYANDRLHGTLGGNILIHPKTIRAIGKKKFEEIVSEFRYGCIGINAWTGVGFLLTQTPWGAFPGHTLDDVQSGIGFVHNTFMFDKPERTIVRQPWRPFPRGLASGDLYMLPRPPWFITNKKQHKVGRLLTNFQHSPSFLKLPRIFLNALLG